MEYSDIRQKMTWREARTFAEGGIEFSNVRQRAREEMKSENLPVQDELH